MLAYHNDPQLKADLLEELAAHRAADHLVKGTYGPNEKSEPFRGCAVGCSVHSLNKRRGLKIGYDDHAGLADAVGMTEVLARLEDTIFENLPAEDAQQWPERLMSAIEPGADLSTVHIDLLIAIQERNLARLDAEQHSEQCEAIRRVLDVLRDWRVGRLNESAAESAWSAAWSAAESARSAARSAAWSAAWSAAESAWSAAWLAESAVRSAAWSAESAEWQWIADTLIEIVRLAPVRNSHA